MWGVVCMFVFAIAAYLAFTRLNFNTTHSIGCVVDELNGVSVFYNGGVEHVAGRNVTADGYNLGLKFQCVEFVKRYYYEYLGHKMPDSYGHAKDFFDARLQNGAWNSKRALLQFSNGVLPKPQVNDLLVFDGNVFNRYGHVAIVSAVSASSLELIQQNSGPFGNSRETLKLIEVAPNNWRIDHFGLLGFLRVP